jgi:ABC-type glycerol-3-phosphate transport system permease component
VIVYGLLGLFAVLFLAPLYVMLVTSLKDAGRDPRRQHDALPVAPTIEPWLKAWGTACVGAHLQRASGAISPTPFSWWFRPSPSRRRSAR